MHPARRISSTRRLAPRRHPPPNLPKSDTPSHPRGRHLHPTSAVRRTHALSCVLECAAVELIVIDTALVPCTYTHELVCKTLVTDYLRRFASRAHNDVPRARVALM
eukprot:IDg16748t1